MSWVQSWLSPAPCRLLALLLALTGATAARAAPAPSRAEAAEAKGASGSRLPAYQPAADEAPRTPADRDFDRLVDEWFAAELEARPSWATRIGIHDHDGRLEKTSRAGFQARLARARQFLARARALDENRLTRNRQLDRKIFASQLESLVLDLDTIRTWERNPNVYIGLVSSSIFGLVKRDFAPVEERLRSVNGRLAAAPEVFANARANLRNPPAIYVDIAVAQGRGLVSFLRETVPSLVADAKDAALLTEYRTRNAAAITAAEEFVAWLEKDLKPRATGDFRLGRDTYQKKLLYDEMVDVPVDTLLAQGYAALVDNHRRMEEVARRINSGKTPRQVLEDMAKDHPAEDQLVATTQAGLDRIKRFIEEKRILTPPPNQNLIVAETPIFQRSLSFASMDSPGIFETRANEAYYNVTPVDSTWSAEKKAEHLGFYNRWALEIVSVHEAFPGHYYQFLHLKTVPSLVRTLMGTGSNSEGWAHYCEEMAIEEGFGGGDPRYELAMLNLALQRIGRYIVGLEMHVNGWTYEKAAEFFEKEAYMARVNAEREARRGTSDPTYLVYSLGKWQIQRLRADVRRAQGDRFVLGEFHDRFLEMGRAPIAVIREAMLGGGI